MNPWMRNLLCGGGGGGGGVVLPPAGRTFLMSKSSLILDEGTGDPTWSRATKAWGFNELGYLEELASGCAFFGGARLVRNLVLGSSEDLSNANWTKSRSTFVAGRLIDTSVANTHRIFQTFSGYAVGSKFYAYCEAKADQHPAIELAISDSNESNRVSVIANLVSGTIAVNSGAPESYSITNLGSGWFGVRIVSTPIAPASMFIHLIDSSNNRSFTGNDIDGVYIRKGFFCNVTNYDASYVPEYVSVGVLSSPYHGAGTTSTADGCKYFETDWQGAPIAAANLLGFRREAAATNNLLYSRVLSNAVWTHPTGSGAGSEILTNGTFGDSTGWSLGAAWAVGTGSLNMNTAAPDSLVDNTQTFLSLVTGRQYLLEFDFTYTSGTVPYLYVRGTLSPSISASTGRKSVKVTCGSSAAGYGIRIASAAAGVCSFDNMSLKEAPVQCAQTATGLDGIANTATTLTAGAADAIILQPTSGIASAARCASAYVKRRTGTGTISFTQDGGGSWTDITAQINGSTWSRVQITSTLANPSVGFKISTSGDAIDVDCVQNEAGPAATSPIVTTTATVTRNADSLTYQTASNWSDTAGTAYIEAQPWQWSSGGLLGSATNGLLESASNSGATAYDGTNAANGPTGTPSGRKKLALRWTGSTMDVSVGGVIGTAGTYDSAMGLASLGIAVNSSGYFGPSAVWNYAMTDDEFKALTT